MYTCDISFDLVTKNVSGSEKRVAVTHCHFLYKKKSNMNWMNTEDVTPLEENMHLMS